MKTIFILLVCIIGCRKGEPQDPAREVRADVRIAVIRSGEIEETVNAGGSTIFLKQVQLRSPIAGVIVRFNYFNGDKVKNGETIAAVRTRESAASLKGAEEILRSATTENQRAEARKAIELARNSLNQINIQAPLDGILSGKMKNETEVIAEGEQIGLLVDPSSIIFVADVPASSINKIKPDEHVHLKFNTRSDKIYEGIVHSIEPQVNQADQTVRVQIVFASETPDLKESLFGEASIIIGKKQNILLAPVSALLQDDENGTTNIMLVSSDSLARKVEIKTGAKRDSLVEVSSPSISAGSVVIIQGQYGLPDSTKIRIIP